MVPRRSLKRNFKHYELNEYKNRIYENFCDKARTMLRRVFVELICYKYVINKKDLKLLT